MTLDSVVDECITGYENGGLRERLKSMLRAEVEKAIDEVLPFDNPKYSSLMVVRESLLGGADKDDDYLTQGKSVIKNGIAHNSPVLTSETPSEKKEAK